MRPIKLLKSFLSTGEKLKKVEIKLKKLNRALDDQKLLFGRHMANLLKDTAPGTSLGDTEFKIFSQFGEDGIIQFLIQNIEIENKFFIEFGVERYIEANTRFLLMNNNWRGLILDSSMENIQAIQKNENYWRYDLTAKQAFVATDNINALIREEEISGDIGLLSIDIDGNDYWIWKAIDIIHPIIVIIEYNSVFGCDRSITTPFRADFDRTRAHFSDLYFGASLLALCDLAGVLNYAFVGCNHNGTNAFFVRNDKIGKLNELSPEEGFVESKFRESRDPRGGPTFLSGSKRNDVIKGLPIFNVRKDSLEKL